MNKITLTLALAAAAHIPVAAPASATPGAAAALSVARAGAQLDDESMLGEHTGKILGILGGAITAIGALFIVEDDDDPDSP